MKNKILKGIAAVACSAVMCVGFSGCIDLQTGAVGISSIEKTDTQGLVDTYTIYYTDGTTSTYTVTNGSDGSDGDNGTNGRNGVDGTNGTDGTDGTDGVTIQDIYEKYKTETGEDISYADFLKQYLTVNEEVTSKTINKCALSTLTVYSEYTIYSNNFSRTTRQTWASGSSVIYSMGDEYSYLLTNYHVVYNSTYSGYKVSSILHAYFYGSIDEPTEVASGTKNYEYGDYAIDCEYVGGSITADIAVLRVKTQDILGINPQAQAVTLASDYHVGETAFAIGNPEGLGMSATQGIISVDNEFIALGIDTTTRYYRCMRIDTSIYEGSSGGGLFNTNGELIGITNAGNGDDENINYAIPIQIVKGAADNIIYYYNDGDSTTSGIYKITIGVSLESYNSRYVYDEDTGYGKIYEDVTVKEVTTNSIAEKLGIASGDVLKSITVNGKTYDIARYFDVSDILYIIRVGDSISFTYTHNKEEQTTQSYTVQTSDLSSVA